MDESKECKPVYEEIDVLSKSQIEACFERGVYSEVCRALISSALYEEDYEWAFQKSVEFLHRPDERLRCTALIAIAHLVRLHQRKIDIEEVEKELAWAKTQVGLEGHISDVEDDLEIFVYRKDRRRRKRKE